VAKFVQQKSRSGVVVGAAAGDPIYSEIAQPNAFESALEHVVANAIEASPEPESVRLSVKRENGRIRVDVEDKGEGMSPDFVAHELFRPLHTTKKKGLGIGAYQARETMRKLGGDIEVQSKLGEGTTVTLYLPACKETETRA
jgi:signal transduction histidine kinase